jgi:peptidyl-dipeptidase Dcp
MARRRRAAEAVAADPRPPSFDNTVLPLERAAAAFTRVRLVFDNLDASNTNPVLQATRRAVAPEIVAMEDAIHLDPALFARVDALWRGRDTLGLDAESARLLWRYHEDFVRAGAMLPAEAQARLRALNVRISQLETTFAQNTLQERGASAVVFDTRAELDGLSDAQIAAAADAARAAGQPGRFLVELVNTTGQPVLSDLRSHAARERVMAASLARGSRGGQFDNRATVVALVHARAQKAALLGYPSFAALQLAEQTVGSIDTLDGLLAKLAPEAEARMRREAGELQKLVDADQGGFRLGAADWAYYEGRLRAARFAVDPAELRPYYELDHVILDGVFYAAHRLYGLDFKERHDLPVYEPSVRVFDVLDADGKPLAIFIGDYYARRNKNGGAWMNYYVPQDGMDGSLPVVVNNLNIPRPPAGEPTLLTQDEVITAFHEFGHALHGMLSHTRYPRFAGPNVPRDFVEYPSQFNEMWATDPEVLRHFARDYRTGATIPQALVDRVMAAMRFDEGFQTTEYLAATLLDQAWHQAPEARLPTADGLVAFEDEALRRAGVDFPPVPPRYRSTYFSHAFQDGYAAGYYSYLWSDVLAADSVAWVKRHGGLSRATGEQIRAKLLSRGGSADPLSLFRDLTGGPPDLGPLLEKRGLD